MTLTEFLLARIAEDEERGGCNGPDSSCDRQFERVLAECKAKRCIVNEIEGTRATATYTTRLLTIVMHLALPYADHPDYRQEWKP